LIGIGNALLNFLIDYAEESIQCLSNKEWLLRDQVRKLEQMLAVATVGIERWNEEGKPRLELLKKEMAEYEKFITEHDKGELAEEEMACFEEVKHAWERCELERLSLTEEIEQHRQTAESSRKKLQEKKSVLKTYRKERKTDADSLYTSIDKLLAEYRICRAAYHGGDLQGNDVIKFMKSASELMPRVAQLFVDSKDEKCKKSDSQIRQVCKDIEIALTLWDKVFTMCQKHNPSPDDCDKTQLLINMAMKAIRKLGLSITPKLHGMEDHVVNQMRNIKGGIGPLMEYWIEHYHQIGSKFDRKCRHARSAMDLAQMRVRDDTMRNHPQVKQQLNMLQEKFKRKFNKEGDGKMAKKAQMLP
jgi:polyhydroxyalkanoate synthesis regulator protein